jgi:hypothetical protein
VNSQRKVYRQPNFRRGRPTCTHCGLLGHVVEKCYKIHGYPPGYIPGYKSNKTRITVGLQVHSSNPLGHFAHQVQEFSENNFAPSMAITSEQCKQLLALMQPKMTSSFANQVGSTSTHDHIFSNMAGTYLHILFFVLVLNILFFLLLIYIICIILAIMVFGSLALVPLTIWSVLFLSSQPLL